MFIVTRVTLADVRQAKPAMIFYGAVTPWWTHDERHLCKRPGSGIPCDPRGGVLFQTSDAEDFLRSAEQNPEQYGRHGLAAFMAAHYENCQVSEQDERGTCGDGWDDYNDALDKQRPPQRTQRMAKKTKAPKPPLTEADVLRALHERFGGKYVCFSHVKDGPSYGRQYRQMDFMAIQKTWSPPCLTMVEVKLSRADFQKDQKWPDYMALCHRFYWCCPKGIISPDEVDKQAGLLWVNEKGHVYTRRKAIYRRVELDAVLLLYLILWRAAELSDRRSRIEDVRREMRERTITGRDYAFFVSTQLEVARGLVYKAEAEAETATIRAKRAAERASQIGELHADLKQLLGTAYGLKAARKLLRVADAISHRADTLVELAEAVKGAMAATEDAEEKEGTNAAG